MTLKTTVCQLYRVRDSASGDIENQEIHLAFSDEEMRLIRRR